MTITVVRSFVRCSDLIRRLWLSCPTFLQLDPIALIISLRLHKKEAPGWVPFLYGGEREIRTLVRVLA